MTRGKILSECGGNLKELKIAHGEIEMKDFGWMCEVISYV
jgi:hypothetical protein